mgnify:FL=1
MAEQFGQLDNRKELQELIETLKQTQCQSQLGELTSAVKDTDNRAVLNAILQQLAKLDSRNELTELTEVVKQSNPQSQLADLAEQLTKAINGNNTKQSFAGLQDALNLHTQQVSHQDQLAHIAQLLEVHSPKVAIEELKMSLLAASQQQLQHFTAQLEKIITDNQQDDSLHAILAALKASADNCSQSELLGQLSEQLAASNNRDLLSLIVEQNKVQAEFNSDYAARLEALLNELKNQPARVIEKETVTSSLPRQTLL